MKAMRRPEYFNKIVAISVAVAIIAIGTIFLIATKAATPTTAVETELGTKSGNATAANDTSASGGQYIGFNAPATPPPSGSNVSSTTPCVGNAAPAQWKHIVVLMFENKTYSSVIGSSNAPYITSLASKCGSYTAWKDANYKVTGSSDGSYNSKPNYATLTSGVPPSVHGLKDDSYSTTSSVDNIFNRFNNAGKSQKTYQPGPAGQCSTSNYSGAYHDAMRYYTNIGAQSSSPSTFCNTHDVNISTFMTDVNAGNLPNFSIVLPTNDQNMHNNSISSGDTWAKDFLNPLLDSAQYKSGDTAIFFLWDEDTPIPNVLIAPSIKAGSHPSAPSGNPISHFSATRTWQEMLGLSPTLGDTGQAPSLLNYYNGN
jgi:hypothetical protein